MRFLRSCIQECAAWPHDRQLPAAAPHRVSPPAAAPKKRPGVFRQLSEESAALGDEADSAVSESESEELSIGLQGSALLDLDLFELEPKSSLFQNLQTSAVPSAELHLSQRPASPIRSKLSESSQDFTRPAGEKTGHEKLC